MPETYTAAAPGRVNLIGEHTDYHEGFVMPCAVPLRTSVSLTPRTDRRVLLSTSQYPGSVHFELGKEQKIGFWIDYIQGMTRVLASAGQPVSGFDLRVDSNVPAGSGLASSAALEIATLRALRAAFGLDLSDLDLARLAQRAEVEFVGAPVGIMDQMASSFADEHHALFLDTRTLAFERIPLPAGLELAVIDSGVSHQHADGGYRMRRAESEEAARLLGVGRLRDLDIQYLEAAGSLAEPLVRRARHVVTENARVLDAREALLHGDLRRFGRLLNASHESLREDYEISTDEIDLLVRLAQAEPDVFGARITGGGFGGAIVVAAAAGCARSVAESIVSLYAEETNQQAHVLVPAPSPRRR